MSVLFDLSRMGIDAFYSSGIKCITTCSPKNFDLVKSYGAEEAFDYNSPTCAEDIKAYTKNTLKYVLDVIAETNTMKLCYAAIGRAGGKYTGLEYVNESLALSIRKAVKPDWVVGLALTGKGVALSDGYGSEPSPECRDFGRKWFQTIQRLLDQGKIRSHPPRVMPGKFQGILEGVEIMRRKEVSGEKLVYFIT
jgi:NADPH:quinone reductase-like Zn-dependent oxidoreductase